MLGFTASATRRSPIRMARHGQALGPTTQANRSTSGAREGLPQSSPLGDVRTIAFASHQLLKLSFSARDELWYRTVIKPAFSKFADQAAQSTVLGSMGTFHHCRWLCVFALTGRWAYHGFFRECLRHTGHTALIPTFFGDALPKDWDTTNPDGRDFGNSAPESKTRRHDRHHGKA